MYKGHTSIKKLCVVIFGLFTTAIFALFSMPVSAAEERCSFSDNGFNRKTKNECAYMEQWPIQKITKKQITVLKEINIDFNDSDITSGLSKSDKSTVKNEKIGAGWTQGSARTKDYFVLSLFANGRDRNYLAIFDNNFNLQKLIKENSKSAWQHIHAIWVVPGTNTIRVDVNHDPSSNADALDVCYDIDRVMRNDGVIQTAPSSVSGIRVKCNDSVIPTNRSKDRGLVYQADAVYNFGSKKYTYTALWDAGEKSWLNENEWMNKHNKVQCGESQSGCIYQHESEGMHYRRHDKVIQIKDASDGKTIKELYIQKSIVNGELESVSFDPDGNLIMTAIKLRNGKPIVTVFQIAKEVHAPAYVSEELKEWFSANGALMGENFIKMSEELSDADRIVICNTNKLSDTDHAFCVKTIYKKIKQAIQSNAASTIPQIRSNTTRKIFNEAVATFKKDKYISKILANIKTTKIAKKTLESFGTDTMTKVFQVLMNGDRTSAKRAVKYLNKVSISFAKEIVEKMDDANLIKKMLTHSSIDPARIPQIACNHGKLIDKLKGVLSQDACSTGIVTVPDSNMISMLDGGVVYSNINYGVSALLTKSGDEDDDVDPEDDADDDEDRDDPSVTDDDINTNLLKNEDDDADATIGGKDWQDDIGDGDDGDEDFYKNGEGGDSEGGDGDKEDDPSVPGTSCDPEKENCDRGTGFTQQSTAGSLDVCDPNRQDVPDIVRQSAGCTDMGNNDLGHRFDGIINAIIAIIGIVAVVGMIYGGVQYMTAQGDTAKMQTAKRTVMYCAIGLAIVILSAAIVNWVIGASS